MAHPLDVLINDQANISKSITFIIKKKIQDFNNKKNIILLKIYQYYAKNMI